MNLAHKEFTKINYVARDQLGKIHLNILRKEKKIPAVLYSNTSSVKHLAICNLSKIKVFKNMFIKLVEKDTNNIAYSIIKDLQINPVTRGIIHIDFFNVQLLDNIDLKVPISFENIEKLPGKLNIVQRSIRIRCNVRVIPKSIRIDLSRVSQKIKIKLSNVDLLRYNNITILDSLDIVIAKVR